VSYPLFSIVYIKWNILHKKKKKKKIYIYIFSLIVDSSRNVKPFKYILKVGEKRGLGKRDYVNHGDDILLVTSLVVRYLKRVSKIIDIVIA
jgi:hypothetical protein